MVMKPVRPIKRLQKKARRGARGFPLATISFYGPDDRTASKAAVGIIAQEDCDVVDLRRWHSTARDVRDDESVIGEILDFITSRGVRSVVMPDRIIGCPHEEGVDYPEGTECPTCVFWQGRDRWSGKVRH